MNSIQVHNYVTDNETNYVSRQEIILLWEDRILSKRWWCRLREVVQVAGGASWLEGEETPLHS